MNRYSICLLLALFVAALTYSCDEKTPVPEHPTAITLSADELVFTTADAASLPLTVTAPSQPTFSDMPDWLSVTDGTFQDYQTTVMFNVTENTATVQRIATVIIRSIGAPPITVNVTQYGAGFTGNGLPDNDAVKRTLELGIGWNLGNHLDSYSARSGGGYMIPDETAWGNPRATQQTFDKLRSYGFTSVRIPVTWLGSIGPAPDYTIYAKWMARVTEVVEYAHKAGLQVIINTHHDENHGDDHWLNIGAAPGNVALNQQIKEEITAVWTQIAENFKDCGDWLMFEGFNELNDGGWGWSADFRANPMRQCGVLNEWQQTFVDAVRATGGNNATRWLGISTYAANPEYEKYLVMPTDPAGKLMLSVHCYDPSDYTIGDAQYSDWGHTGQKGKKANGGDEDHIQKVFKNLFDKYIVNNIPVYLGEYGCSMRNKSDARSWAFYLYYLEYVSKAARTFAIPAMLWDNGSKGWGKERHGYIDHGTGEFTSTSQAPVDAILKGWCTNDESYTLDTVYNSAPVF